MMWFKYIELFTIVKVGLLKGIIRAAVKAVRANLFLGQTNGLDKSIHLGKLE